MSKHDFSSAEYCLYKKPGHMFQIPNCCSVGPQRPRVTPERPASPGERTNVLGPRWRGGGNGRGVVSAARCLQGWCRASLGAVPNPPPGYLVFEVRLCAVFPLLKHVGQLVQATVVEVEHLVLAFPAGDDQLAAGAGLIAEWPSEGGREQIHEYVNMGFYFQV